MLHTNSLIFLMSNPCLAIMVLVFLVRQSAIVVLAPEINLAIFYGILIFIFFYYYQREGSNGASVWTDLSFAAYWIEV